MNIINKNPRLTCIILMLALAVDSFWNMLKYYRLRQQMDTPLVPEWVVDELTIPYIITASVTAAGAIAALIFFMKTNYKVTMIICAIGLLVGYFIFDVS